jgi:transitional endoplasmic reticulum ATPase
LPDYEARKQLFKIHLEGRFNEDSIDIDQLARQTEGYVASDISYIVNEAAIESAMADVPISQACLLDEISRTSPSVTQDDAADYARMRAKFEQRSVGNHRRKVGFMQN